MNLPTNEELNANSIHLSIHELAEQLYPDLTYDCALPQDWVDAAYNLGQDVRGHVVWAYPQGYLFGYPLPITEEGAHMLGKLSVNIGRK